MTHKPADTVNIAAALFGHTEQSALEDATRPIDSILKERHLTARVILGNGSITVGDTRNEPGRSVGLVFKSRRKLESTLRRLRLLDFSKAYLAGDLEFDGDIRQAVRVLDIVSRFSDPRQSRLENVWSLCLRVVRGIFPKLSWHFESLDHYRQSASAYELFLDDWMQYTCGRFATGEEDITQAQEAKFIFIRDLAEKHFGDMRNARHLDIGCGWGGMLAYFEREFGTQSVGVTNTPQQAEYARRRFGVEVIDADFKELEKSSKQFDIITIVGMMEHLAPRRRDDLLRTVHGLLSDRGVVYLQCIARPEAWIGGDAYRVAQEIVFPGNYVEYPKEMKKRISAAGFELREFFEHGSDYAHTTARWVERIQNNFSCIAKFIGTKQARIFLGYLAYASMLFESDRGNLVRCVFQKNAHL